MVTALLLLLTCSCLPALPGSVRGGEFEVDLMPHLEKLSKPRYPMETNTNNRNEVKDYIIERMKNYGLDVKQQKFNVTIGNDPTGIGSELIVVSIILCDDDDGVQCGCER